MGSFLSHTGPVHGLQIHNGRLYTCSGDNTARAYCLMVLPQTIRNPAPQKLNPCFNVVSFLNCYAYNVIQQTLSVHPDQGVQSVLCGSHKQSELSAGVIGPENSKSPLHRSQ